MQQDYIIRSIRASAVLTTSYVAGTVIGPTSDANDSVPSYNQMVLYVSFTIGSLTNGKIKVEFSHDGTTYYQETYSNVSAGVSTESLGDHTMAGTGNYRIPVPIKDNYVRISAIGTGTVTNSLMAILAVLGVA